MIDYSKRKLLESSNIYSTDYYQIKKKGGKCLYQCHVATVFSVEQSISILDTIGVYTDSDDCLPFALRLVEDGELVVISEDNGEYSIGQLLAESLSKFDGYNVLICISRYTDGSCVHDMYNSQKRVIIKKAIAAGVDILLKHIGSFIYSNNPQHEEGDDDYDAQSIMSVPKINIHTSAIHPTIAYENSTNISESAIKSVNTIKGCSKGIDIVARNKVAASTNIIKSNRPTLATSKVLFDIDDIAQFTS